MANTPELVLNGTVLTGSFNVKAPQPLDAKAVVKHRDHLDQLVEDEFAYVGMVVYVNSNDNTKGLYVCISLEDNGVWEPMGAKLGDSTNITIVDNQVSLVSTPNVQSIGIGDTTSEAPVSLQYDSTLGALKFVFS